jgi:ElaB/YqjD/DUF883 family membrane-anchored ribosome-binding protein
MESRIVTPKNDSPTQTTNRLVEHLKTTAQRSKERAVERAKAADKVVRDHPYQTIGVAAGLAVLIGFLVGRKWRT